MSYNDFDDNKPMQTFEAGVLVIIIFCIFCSCVYAMAEGIIDIANQIVKTLFG